MSTAGPLTANRPERVAVVIPAKNEEERIESTIRAARQIHGVDMVVVVDDGSTDSTAALAMGADALVVRHKANRGKAAAMATGAQLVAIREEAARAEGTDAVDGSEALPGGVLEEREAGHTGPLPVIGGGGTPRALLFLDADMGASAVAAQPLVDAVLEDGVDMAIALLPPQVGAGGMGIVVRTARSGIRRATGWEPTQPLSGTRCITREAWDACQPLAAGWGVETSLTIDALDGGFWVKEVDCELHHRVTGNDLAGRLHRAAQLRDVLRALARRRHVSPGPIDDEVLPEEPGSVSVTEPGPARAEPQTDGPEPEIDGPEPGVGRDEPGQSRAAQSVDSPEEPSEPDAAPSAPSLSEPDATETAPSAEDPRRAALAVLPVEGELDDDHVEALEGVDAPLLASRLRSLPVRGGFTGDDIVYLSRTDLVALRGWMDTAPVSDGFRPEHAAILASHLDVRDVAAPADAGELTGEEYVSLVVHAAVDAGNRGD